jgi:kynureninase
MVFELKLRSLSSHSSNIFLMSSLIDEALSKANAIEILESDEFCSKLDSVDPLSSSRSKFLFPPTPSTAVIRAKSSQSLYLCGNSLGLQPTRTREYVNEELDKWSQYGVEGHFHPNLVRPWVSIDESVVPLVSPLVGATEVEVAVMNTLTVNLHLLMTCFYNPSISNNKKRTRIIIEEHAFPSDHYMVTSQVLLHGLDPTNDLIIVKSREGMHGIIHENDLLECIEANKEELALVLWPAVQYYTGQSFDLQKIAAKVHSVGAIIGVDAAHGAGNIPLKFHDWEIDFAAWCSYKFMNSGPGGISGIFVHEKYAPETLTDRPFCAGWFGTLLSERFNMSPEFNRILGAGKFQLSNPPVLEMATHRAALEIFHEAGGMDKIFHSKSVPLTKYLLGLITNDEVLSNALEIITPWNDEKGNMLKDSEVSVHHGSAISVLFRYYPKGVASLKEMSEELKHEGIIIDTRKPNAMRIAPVPLYNSFRDVLEFTKVLKVLYLRE